jgi:NAD(P)-dependent dehydrogenase (short-subunit alcohol dehydrogenase family)
MTSQKKLEGLTALVTGGGQGLGEAICRTLAKEGVEVLIADIQTAAASKVAETICNAGGKAQSLALNVADRASVARAVEAIERDHGRLDILINNAGTDVTKPIDELSEDEWDRVLHVNLFGPFYLSKKLLPMMEQQGGGSIINIASTAAKRAWANASAYHASKWGLLGFTHALHVEARAKNVRVTALVAGGMRTPFIMDRFPDTDPSVLQDPKSVAQVIITILTLPPQSVIAEIMVLPLKETSWP